MIRRYRSTIHSVMTLETTLEQASPANILHQEAWAKGESRSLFRGVLGYGGRPFHVPFSVESGLVSGR